MQTKHRVTLRPSSSSTWTKCSAMPWLLEKNKHLIPKSTGDESWTKEGDLAHLRAAKHLRGIESLSDIHDPVWSYVNCVNRAKGKDDVLIVETKSPTFYDPDYEGTVDTALICLDGSKLDIFDLKYGQGVDVDAYLNTQLAIYWRSIYDALTSLGLMEHMELTTPVNITICQPRHWNAKKIDTWETNVGDLFEMTNIMKLQAEKIQQQRGLEFAPSESTCQFCPARAVCIERHKWELQNLPLLDGHLSVMDSALTSEIYKRRHKIKAWMDQIEKYVKDDVSAGGELSDMYEWGEGKRLGNTRWTDEAQLKKFMLENWKSLDLDDLYNRSLMSPNQMTAMVLDKTGEQIGKEYFSKQKLTWRPPAKQVIREKTFNDDSTRKQALNLLRDIQVSLTSATKLK